MTGSPDPPSQYVPAMNGVFAAQRAGIPVDVCLLGGAETSFLHQAPQITGKSLAYWTADRCRLSTQSALAGGVYLRPERPGALLQYLLSSFSSDPYTRSVLKTGTLLDAKVPCFCHRSPIDTGFVCSVCLSIFCTKVEQCQTCGASFKQPAEAKTG